METKQRSPLRARARHAWHGVVTTSSPVALDTDDPYRSRGWSPIAKLAAANRVRSVIDDETGLLAVSEAAAETICAIMAAKTVSVVLLDERGYCDLVNVGEVGPGDMRFPDDTRYPMSRHPAAGLNWLAGVGYVSSPDDLDVLAEYRRLWPGFAVGSVLGVPIMSGRRVCGEMFMLRGVDVPSFTEADMNVVVDLAAQLGHHLPELVSAHDQGESVDYAVLAGARSA